MIYGKDTVCTVLYPFCFFLSIFRDGRTLNVRSNPLSLLFILFFYFNTQSRFSPSFRIVTFRLLYTSYRPHSDVKSICHQSSLEWLLHCDLGYESPHLHSVDPFTPSCEVRVRSRPRFWNSTLTRTVQVSCRSSGRLDPPPSSLCHHTLFQFLRHHPPSLP